MDAQQQAVMEWVALVVAAVAGGVASGLAQQRWWGGFDRRR
jgi:hypothetical protein